MARRGFLGVLLVMVVLVMGGCGTAEAPPAAAPMATGATLEPGPEKFAGAVAGSRTFAGIVAEGERAVALVTDGTESVSVFAWFEGAIEDGTFETTTNNITLSARIGNDAASGTLTMPDGRNLSFVLPRVRGGAGVYRAESSSTGQPYTAGWIVLPDGEQRAGAAYGIGTAGRVVTVLPMDFGPDTRPIMVDVPGVGRFQPEPLLP